MVKPKYNIGDTVWVPQTTWQQIWTQCPDCLGTKHWQCILPSKETFLVGCRRCYQGGATNQSTGFVGETYETTAKSKECIITGMAIENGIWKYKSKDFYEKNENELFDNPVDALDAATDSALKDKKQREKQFFIDVPKRKRGEEGMSDPISSINYAREQVRRALTDANRWVAYAQQNGASFSLKDFMKTDG